MTESPALPAVVPPASPSTVWVAALGTLAAAGIVCLLVYLVLAAPGAWFGGASPLRWTASELSLKRGTGQLSNDVLVLTAPDPARTILVSVPTSLRSRDYLLIAWDVVGIPEGVDATLLWRSDYQPGRVFSRSLAVESGRITPALVARDPNWIGRVDGLALLMRGPFTEPIIVHGAVAKPMTPAQVLGDRVSEWLAFEPWNGASINNLVGGADTQNLPLPVLVAGLAAIAALAYAALARWRLRALGPSLGVVVATFFVGAWFIVDARWQWNLLRQANITRVQYAGKTWRERHLAAEDGALFAFIEKVRSKLPAPPARVFLVADAHYFRGRGAYHLYPYNVYIDPWSNTMPPPSALRPGDYFVVYQRRSVEYDAAKQLLRWDGQAPVPAELLFADSVSALFRIR